MYISIFKPAAADRALERGIHKQEDDCNLLGCPNLLLNHNHQPQQLIDQLMRFDLRSRKYGVEKLDCENLHPQNDVKMMATKKSPEKSKISLH